MSGLGRLSGSVCRSITPPFSVLRSCRACRSYMPFANTHCKETEGWQSRLGSKTGIAALGGSALGSILAIAKGKPVAAYSSGTGISCLVCVGGFAGLQEITRLLRCADSPANSIVAGAVTGSILAGVQRGKAATIPAAAVCGAAAGFSHLLWLQAQPGWRLRVWLVQQGLLEDDCVLRRLAVQAAHQQQLREAAKRHFEGQQPSRKALRHAAKAEHEAPVTQTFWQRVLNVFGLHKLDDVEWARYEFARDAEFQDRLQAAGVRSAKNQQESSEDTC